MNTAPNAQFSITHRRALYRGADWGSVFGAVGCGESLGVVLAARGSMRSTERCIQAIFAAHHDAGWRASLWITVLVDGCRGGMVAEARRELGAFGEVLNVRAHSPQELYGIGAGAIERHFEGKGGATMVFTTPELVDLLEPLARCA
jgi:hypothetical protein